MKKLGVILLMLISISTFSQTIVYNENFDNTSQAVTSSGSPGWSINSNFFVSGNNCDSATIVNSGDSSVLITDFFSTLGNSFVILEFDHICKTEVFDDAVIYVSTDNGQSWVKLTENEYQGAGAFTANSGNKFTSASYLNTWAPFITTTPLNNWWKHETFDISAIAGNKTNVKIRFDLVDINGTSFLDNYAWLIDNIKVSASVSEPFPPTISFVTIPNTVINNNGPIEISAKITDASGISSALLIYTSNNGAPDTVNMVYYTNNIYTGFINPTAVTSNDTICFYISANDNSPNQNNAIYPPIYCRQIIVQPYPTIITSCDTVINTFPYFENFDSFPLGSNSCYAVNPLVNNWINDTIDDKDWCPYSGSAGKVGYAFTGPPADHTIGDSLYGKYLYLESDLCQEKTANLITPCFDLTGMSNPQLKFWYYIPTSISIRPTLYVEIYFNGQWQQIDTITNTFQGWQQTTTDLSNYKNLVKFRFIGKTGVGIGNWRRDVAIDDISIYDNPVIPILNDAGIIAIESPVSGANAGNNMIKARLKNFASSILNSVDIVWEVNGVIQDTMNWTYPIYNLGDNLVSIDTFNFPAGNNTIKVWTINPNQLQDSDTTNDLSVYNLSMCNGALSGTYTINSAIPSSTTNFTSISGAIDILKYCGVNGPVVINIASGTYYENILLDTIQGVSFTNTITFRSSTGNSSNVIIKKANNQAKIKFENSSHIRFEKIKFKSIPISFEGVFNKDIQLSSNNFTGSSITSISASTDSLVLIDSNYFYSCAINIDAPSTSKSWEYTISNNIFKNISSYMVQAKYIANINIIANVFDTTSTTIPQKGFYLIRCANAEIINNKIICTNYGIQTDRLGKTVSTYNLIANNFIIVKGSSTAYGMHHYRPRYVNIYYNSINILNTAATSAVFYHDRGNNSFFNIKNNIFINKGGGYSLIFNISIGAVILNNNIVYTSGSNCVKHNLSIYSSLLAWQTASNQDANSLSSNVVFNSTNDLHSSYAAIVGVGTPLSLISDDIDGDTRNAIAPNIGADEFYMPAVDASIAQIIRPFANDSSGISRSVVVEIKNCGSDTLFSFNISYKINNGIAVPTTINDTLLPLQLRVYNLTSLTIPSGNNTITVYTEALNDGNHNNDTSSLSFYGLYPNDAKTKILYTLGKLPLNSGAMHHVKAVIENKGFNPIVNLNVNLNISGTNSFANVHTIDTLHFGEIKTISFAPYTPILTGVDNIKVSIQTDNDNSNNELKFRIQ